MASKQLSHLMSKQVWKAHGIPKLISERGSIFIYLPSHPGTGQATRNPTMYTPGRIGISWFAREAHQHYRRPHAAIQ
jgi:hypothetical protein